jgi:predicted peptidase
MHSKLCFAVFSVVLATPSLALAADPQAGVQVAQELTIKISDRNSTMRYWLFLPASYDQEKSWPLMLFLHGAGERGDNLAAVKKWGPPKLVGKKKDFPFVVISPQCRKGDRWNSDELHALVEHVATSQKIDRSRMYCTGLSMGGFGTWSILAKYPQLFAAAVPICGGGNPAQAERMMNVPIWAFHGDADGVVPLSRSSAMTDAIKKAGGDNAKLTVYPGVGHNSWSKTYANENVYQWLLSHRIEPSKSK